MSVKVTVCVFIPKLTGNSSVAKIFVCHLGKSTTDVICALGVKVLYREIKYRENQKELHHVLLYLEKSQ